MMLTYSGVTINQTMPSLLSRILLTLISSRGMQVELITVFMQYFIFSSKLYQFTSAILGIDPEQRVSAFSDKLPTLWH